MCHISTIISLCSGNKVFPRCTIKHLEFLRHALIFKRLYSSSSQGLKWPKSPARVFNVTNVVNQCKNYYNLQIYLFLIHDFFCYSSLLWPYSVISEAWNVCVILLFSSLPCATHVNSLKETSWRNLKLNCYNMKQRMNNLNWSITKAHSPHQSWEMNLHNCVYDPFVTIHFLNS